MFLLLQPSEHLMEQHGNSFDVSCVLFVICIEFFRHYFKFTVMLSVKLNWYITTTFYHIWLMRLILATSYG